ncbi:dihydrofolate reductase family protein [Amycolatopsis nigrescens]|uniref:dihydrofolate reductase family protein n=1 Tax=Amycolatopsis nigrescens TaxID=381445 RepID=UPI0003623DB3|nr:dihydrofolate reductase family protein [Amycolatopsis nigrescens]
MRKVILQEIVSVDGFAAGPQGELGFFDAVDDYSEVDQDNLRILAEVDTIVLGAETYRLFVEYWPTADDEPVAKSVNAIPKLVFSSTMDSAPWGRWPAARVVRGPATDEIAALKRKPGGDIMVWGSISLAQTLLQAGLVDEIQLRVCPVLLGRGRRLFDDAPAGLELIEAKPYRTGMVSLRYLRPGRD